MVDSCIAEFSSMHMVWVRHIVQEAIDVQSNIINFSQSHYVCMIDYVPENSYSWIYFSGYCSNCFLLSVSKLRSIQVVVLRGPSLIFWHLSRSNLSIGNSLINNSATLAIDDIVVDAVGRRAILKPSAAHVVLGVITKTIGRVYNVF